MTSLTSPTVHDETRRWYDGVTRYQWVVLIIASLGWVFDVFEGQIFVASMNEAMPSLMERSADESDEQFSGRKRFYDNIALGAFLAGGAVGGIIFGILSDRIGRTRTMTLTIVFYSFFTAASAFSGAWWHLAALRFLVAMGVGGEWAVASSLVYEVFPPHARAHVGSIFHASSVFGTFLAIAAGTFIIGNPYFDELAARAGIPSLPWRIGFGLGVLPALLIIWIRRSLREPESWEAARERAATDSTQQVGRLADLFASGLLRNTLVGFSLAAIGLATFWGVHIYGKNVMQDAARHGLLLRAAAAEDLPIGGLSQEERTGLLQPHEHAIKRWEMLGMLLVTAGGGLGLVSFGPLSQRLGRRGAFLAYHVGGLAAALLVFQRTWNTTGLMALLPVFGFLTLGMHAGYAVYFPELYPTRLRGTGAGFCFNGGRLAAAPILFATGWLQQGGWSLADACSLLSLFYLLGAAVLLFAPETRGRTVDDR